MNQGKGLEWCQWGTWQHWAREHSSPNQACWPHQAMPSFTQYGMYLDDMRKFFFGAPAPCSCVDNHWLDDVDWRACWWFLHHILCWLYSWVHVHSCCLFTWGQSTCRLVRTLLLTGFKMSLHLLGWCHMSWSWGRGISLSRWWNIASVGLLINMELKCLNLDEIQFRMQLI